MRNGEVTQGRIACSGDMPGGGRWRDSTTSSTWVAPAGARRERRRILASEGHWRGNDGGPAPLRIYRPGTSSRAAGAHPDLRRPRRLDALPDDQPEARIHDPRGKD